MSVGPTEVTCDRPVLTVFRCSLAILTTIIPHLFDLVNISPYMHRQLRRVCADYGMPIAIIAMSGFAYWGRFAGYTETGEMTLPTTGPFTPAAGRGWVVDFWNLESKYVGYVATVIHA